MIDPRIDLLIQARQEAAEAIRRAEAAEERCEALSEALRALVGYADEYCAPDEYCFCADVQRARTLLEES